MKQFTTVIAVADRPNRNNRLYPKKVLEQAIVDAKFPINGVIGDSQGASDLCRLSHVVDKLWMDGDEMKASITMLDTPQGQVAQSLIDDLAFVTVGTGKLEYDDNGIAVVTDFNITSISAVPKDQQS